MITFIIGLCILFFGYIFYSNYVIKQFEPTDNPTPANTKRDDIDYLPLSKPRNALIHLLNIAGMGPLLGAIQGILFGPVAFIIIPVGCILMGGVHDYCAGMLSLKEGGTQLTTMISKYLGNTTAHIFTFIIFFSLILVATVFVYTPGELMAENFFGITDFSLTNPGMILCYGSILLYYVAATVLPIDKIIGKFYPIFGGLLIIGTFMLVGSFVIHGVNLTEINFHQINQHPLKFAIIPIFFMTVSCGMLSGFHATQSTIISRTIQNEHDGKQIFFGMMCLECLIAMVWAAGAMHVYNNHLVAPEFIGKVQVLNIISETFLPNWMNLFVIGAIIILPITSGDTALRGLRLIFAEIIGWEKNTKMRCLILSVPIILALIGGLILSEINSKAFFVLWRYTSFTNNLLSIITFLCLSVYLYKQKKNYLITLIPGIIMLFLNATYILQAKIGFNLHLTSSKIIATGLCLLTLLWIFNKMKPDITPAAKH